jgi:DNA polymerase III alpha subunit
MLCGVLSEIRHHTIKSGKNKGENMAYSRLTDLNGSLEFMLFPQNLAKFEHLLIPGKLVQVRINKMPDNESYNASNIIDLEEAFQKQVQQCNS